MADHSKIEWTDATWNPITGCSVVSPGCTNCYAMRLAGTRLQHHPSRAGLTRDSKAGPVWTGEVRVNWEWMDQPLGWAKPRRIFVCAHGDLFHVGVPMDVIAQVYGTMIAAHHLRGHIFQVLTKRSDRARVLLTDDEFWSLAMSTADAEIMDRTDPLSRRRDDARATCGDYDAENPPPGIWLGVSAEDQRRADERVPDLLATPAAVRFVSAEPLLGPIDFERLGSLGSVGSAFPAVLERCRRETAPNTVSGLQIEALGQRGQATIFHQTPDHMGGFSIQFPRPFPRLDWIIVSGESGTGARPMHPDWARSIRDQCAVTGVPFFFKQWGGFAPLARSCPVIEAGGFQVNVAWPDGSIGPGKASEKGGEGQSLYRATKSVAGRLLDGIEHNGMPRTPA